MEVVMVRLGVMRKYHLNELSRITNCFISTDSVPSKILERTAGALSLSPFLSTCEHKLAGYIFRMICGSELLKKYLDDHIVLALPCFNLPVLIKRKSEYIEHVSTIALCKQLLLLPHGFYSVIHMAIRAI